MRYSIKKKNFKLVKLIKTSHKMVLGYNYFHFNISSLVFLIKILYFEIFYLLLIIDL